MNYRPALFVRGLFAIGVLTLLSGNVATCQAQATIELKQETKQQESEKEKGSSGDSGEIEMDLFMRIRRDKQDKPIAMETSVTRYVTKNADGERVTVDLIGVIHIGEKEYYEKLNDLFTKYDALLYELVAPEGTVIPKGGGERGGFSAISMLQQSMQSVLKLEFQLEHIDYTKENFVHADMTPEEFSASMKKNNESLFKMALKAVGQGMARQSKSSAGQATTEMEMMMAMFSDDETKIRKGHGRTDAGYGIRNGDFPGRKWFDNHRSSKRKSLSSDGRTDCRRQETYRCLLRCRTLARYGRASAEKARHETWWPVLAGSVEPDSKRVGLNS